MLKRAKKLVMICAVLGLIVLVSGPAQANWVETWNGAQPDLTTWEFHCWPDLAKTFTQTIKTDPNGNKYLSMDETTPKDAGGSLFGAGFGSKEKFTDVRIGAVVNVTGDASRNYCGFAGRTEYIIDPDGSISGAPGFIGTKIYVMHVNWENGPANLRIDIEKVVMMQNIMRNEEQLGLDVPVPGLAHARSYYAELDILGSGPVYVTGSLYEYKGGPLVARTATMVDTNGNDPWEEEGVNDKVFTSGVSCIFAQSEQLDPWNPVGYHCTFDDVFSVSDGPAAVAPSPADGATDVSINPSLSWVEAAFATSRQLWFGKQDAMQKMAPAPAGKTYDPGPLEFGQTYQWRVDEVGPSGMVTGHTWTFTTGQCLTVDDFESYADNAAIAAKWPHNILHIPPYDYIFLETSIVQQGAKSMRFEYQNQFDPYFTEATYTFAAAQDWTKYGIKALSLAFRGVNENVEQLMRVRLEDASGKSAAVPHPYTYAVESELWRQWDIALEQFSSAGVNLAAVKKITIGFGNGTNSGQDLASKDRDVVYIDDLRVCPARCFNVEQLNLSGDINGDCVVDLKDLAIMGEGWLNSGLSAAP
jgi:hypothetical protein